MKKFYYECLVKKKCVHIFLVWLCLVCTYELTWNGLIYWLAFVVVILRARPLCNMLLILSQLLNKNAYADRSISFC